MKFVVAYLLAVLGGNISPTAEDLKDILASVGADSDEDNKIEKLLNSVKGKDITELIAAGREKLASVPSGGGGVAAIAAAAPAATGATPAAEAKKEEKAVEKEESDDGPESGELAAAAKLHPDILFYQTDNIDVGRFFHIGQLVKHPALVMLKE